MKRLAIVLAVVALAGCSQQPNRMSEEECLQLRAQVTEQQRLQREQARRIDELQKLAAERQRQQREEQHRADDLQQKLDALRAIDRDIRRREQRK
jgi:hypothetical protein